MHTSSTSELTYILAPAMTQDRLQHLRERS